MEWFVAREGKTIGPKSFDDLIAMVRQGQLGERDLLWRTGMEDWVPAAAVSGIYSPPPLPDHAAQQHPTTDKREMVDVPQVPAQTRPVVPTPAPAANKLGQRGLESWQKILWSILAYVVVATVVGVVKDSFRPSVVGRPAETGGNFVIVRLPHGVTIELPRNWVALSNNLRITLDSAVQAEQEKRADFDASSDLAFAANFYDEAGRTGGIFNIRYYPELAVSQAEAQTASSSDVQELDDAIHRELETGLSTAGLMLVQWMGTTKQLVNGKTVFVTDYRRASISRGTLFRVRLVRTFNADNSFTITVSYREDIEVLLRPICDRVISSLRF